MLCFRWSVLLEHTQDIAGKRTRTAVQRIARPLLVNDFPEEFG